MSTQSAYITNLKNQTSLIKQRQDVINCIVKECRTLDEKTLPPLAFVNIIGSDTHAHFKNTMCNTFTELMRRFKLTPESSVLDIGSGCGRIAFPFGLFLTEGKYYGFDVWTEGVAWCNQNLRKLNKKMKFFSIEASNNYYFETFKEGLHNEFRLDGIPDGSIDLAFAISCFTHLIERDCRTYFNEICRVLKPDGAAYITGFVIDRYFFEYVKKTGKHKGVKEKEHGCFYAYEGQDFFGGFTKQKWNEMIEEAGLNTICYNTGDWAEKPGATNFQDIFVVVKP